MAINAEYVGRTYPPSGTYQVSRAKIAEFASATCATNPLYTDVAAARAAGYTDVVAPPTFAVTIAQAAEQAYITDPDARVDFSRVVHAEERFTHHRPLVAGDEVEATVVVDSIVERASIAMVTTRVEIATLAGEAVATVTSTLAIRGVSMPNIDDLTVGQQIGTADFVFDRARLVRYAGASGDFNIIHWNDRFATEVGLPGVIAHGMLTMGVAINVVVDWAGDPGAVVEYGTRFSKMIPVPDPGEAILTVSGTVAAIDTESRRVTVDLAAVFEGQKVLARASATVQL